MLGDPMEIMGLKKGLMTAETSQSKDRTCFLGSVKSNIGHLEAAAGIAGLLKSNLDVARAIHSQDAACGGT